MIVDTNALSAMAEGDAEVGRAVAEATELAIPVIVLGEFRYGIRQSRSRLRYEEWLEDLVKRSWVLVVDEDTAAEYASVREELKRKGRPIPSNDLWIAALARQHELQVLSQDEHFDFVPKLKRLSW